MSVPMFGQSKGRKRCRRRNQTRAPLDVERLENRDLLVCMVPPTSLVSWWPGDGDASDISDASDGIIQNGVTFSTGQVGEAFQFDGEDDFVLIENRSELNPLNSITLDAWVLVSGDRGDVGDIISKDGEDSDRQYQLSVEPGTRHFRAQIGVPDGFVGVEGVTRFRLNHWYHVAMTYNGATLNLYVNGRLDGSVGAVGRIVRSTQPVRIGGGAPAGRAPFHFRGLIDEVSIFNRALPGREIRRIYDAGVDGKCKGLFPNGQEGDNQASIIYDAGTGEVSIDPPAGVELTSFNMTSTAGIFTGDPADNLGGPFDNDTDTNIFKATFDGKFSALSFGTVAEPLLNETFLLNDLTANGSQAGGGAFKVGDLIYIPPSLRPNGQIGDDQTSIIYDTGTGRIEVDAPAGVELTSINIVSTADIFTGDPADNLGGPFDIDNDGAIFKATFDGSFSSLSFGNVARPLLDKAFLANDLAVNGTRVGGGGLGDVDLIYVCSGLCPNGRENDDQLSIIYHAGTGTVAVDPPRGVELTSLNMTSAAAIFTGSPADNLGGPFDNDTDTNIFKATFDGMFGAISFGRVARPVLSEAFLANDLSVIGTRVGGGSIGTADLIYIPSVLLPDGIEGDNRTSIIYDAGTGLLQVDAPVGVQLDTINLVSTAAIFTGDPAENLGGPFDIDNDTTIFKAALADGFGSLSFGNVVQPGLDEGFILSDLAVTGTFADGGSIGDVDLVYRFSNFLPTISQIPNQTVPEDTPTGAISFTVGDLETPPAALTISGNSSDSALVPDENIVFGGSGPNRTVTITPAADQFGTATIALTVRDAAGGTTRESFTLGVSPVNDPPVISNVSNQAILEDTATGAISFTVGDLETPPSELSISGNSSDSFLVPDENIVIGGSGPNRTVTITPAADQFGTATITLTLRDAAGETATKSFTVGVSPVNDLPVISNVPNQATVEDASVASIPFTIDDVETSADALTLTSTSSNPALVPDANVVIAGRGNDRTVSITPLPNQSGTTTVTLNVRDAHGGSAAETFLVTVVSVNDLPTISNIAVQSTRQDTPTDMIPFMVGDLETPAEDLEVTATSSSALVPSENIVFGGSGINRTLVVTPAASQSGSTRISVTVQDADGGTATSVFVLQVGAFVPQPGDSNGDREFNQFDLVTVLQAAKYLTGEAATFAEGDWNKDGIFDPRDIVAALQTGNYLQGPYAADARDIVFAALGS